MNQVFSFGRMGWTCPGCRRCYSPDTAMCFYCPGNITTTVTTTPAVDLVPPTPQPGPTPPAIYPWPWTPPQITWTPVTPNIAGPATFIPCTTGQCDPMHNYTCATCEAQPSPQPPCGCDTAAGGYCSKCD